MKIICQTVSNETKGYCINVPKLLQKLGKNEFDIEDLSKVDIDKFILNLSLNIDGKVLSWSNLTEYSTKDLKVLKINNQVVHPKYYMYVGIEVEILFDSNKKPIGWAPKNKENDTTIKTTSTKFIVRRKRIDSR